MTPVETLAEVARSLNSARPPADALALVAESIRQGAAAASVAVWLREPGAMTYYAITSPSGPMQVVPSLAAIPLASDGSRADLWRDGVGLGALTVIGGGPDTAALLSVAADILAPYLASLQRAAELSLEVAVQSRAIEDERRFTSLVIDSLPVGLYVVDREYRIRVWNRKRETGTQGLRRDDVVGRSVFDVLTRQPADELRTEFDTVFATGGIREADLEVSGPDGSSWYRITRIPMRLDGDAISHVITIGEDVSARLAMQQHALQSEKLAAIGQLAAGVMHEINNPLATIGACVAACEMRLRDVTGAGVAALLEYCEIMDKEVQRCTMIVDGLLDFSRPQGKTKRRAELARIADDTLFLLKHHPRFRSLTLVRKDDPAVPPVLANVEQLIQVLMAIMLNALDAMEHGGRLGVRTRTGPRPGEVAVEVEDSGAGIPAADHGRIFEPFYTTKPPGRGTGLGLSICYGVVQEHGGRIEVESQPGKGTLFRIVLPAARESA